MALYCPITGYEVFSHPEWLNHKVSDTFTSNFRIIGHSIIYSSPRGHADLIGTKKSLALNAQVASVVTGGIGPYVQIEDYAHLHGSSLSARRFITNTFNNSKRRLTIIFCNLSPPLSIAIKIGRRFNTSGKYLHVAKHYKDAIQQAVELSGQGNLPLDTAPIDLSKYIADHYHSLVPVDVRSDDAWEIQTPEFSNNSVVIDQCILHSTTKGFLEPEHIPHIERMRDRCQSDIADTSPIKYFVIDARKMKGVNRLARAKYMQSLKNWHQRFPIRMFILYGANTFIKTAAHLAKPLMPFKIRIVNDMAHAFQLIRKDRSKNLSKPYRMRLQPKSAVIAHDDIEKFIALFSRINWEQEGIQHSLNIGENHPLYFLYQSIKLVKEELDDLFKERRIFENALQQSEDRFRTLAESSPSAFLIIRDDQFLYVNSTWEKIIGYNKKEALAMSPRKLFYPYAEETFLKNNITPATSPDLPLRHEVKIITKDAQAKWIGFIAKEIPYEEATAILLIAADITERKREEEARRESEERYRSLFENNHSVMLLIDPETGNIVDANSAAIAYYGWSHKQITHMQIADINTFTNEQVNREKEIAKQENRKNLYFKHRLANADIRDVEVYSGPIKMHGKQLLYSIIHDITERKIVETERNQLIRDLQVALKEIKTLRGILPFCSICKKIRDDKGYWEKVDVYIHKYSQADISHSLCPDCAQKHYPDLQFDEE